MKNIRLSHVEMPEMAINRVTELMRAGKIGQTEEINEFERVFSNWVGSKYAVAVSSGTMADTIALAVLKEFNPSKNEVILPALTFAAQLNSVIYNGLKPVFIDVLPNFQMNVCQSIEKITKKTLCLYPVHLLGIPCDILSLKQIRSSYKIPFIEDSCEAIGSEFDPGLTGFKKCGTFGEMGTFSFFPSHTITTGEGGMIVTDDYDFYDVAKTLRNHGKKDGKMFHFDYVGFNGKITSLQASVGISAVSTIDDVIRKRKEIYRSFGGRDDLTFKTCPHAFPIMAKSKEKRDELLNKLDISGVECRNLFSSLPTQEKAYEYLGHRLGEFPISESIGDKGLYVPCHQGMDMEDVGYIMEVLCEEEKAEREALVA